VAASILGILLVGLAAFGYRELAKRKRLSGYSFGSLLLLVCLLHGVWLSPLMDGEYHQDGICRADIPGNYQKIAQELTDVIPSGSQVLWEANAVVPLLYAPDISIYIPPIYAVFTFRVGGDPQLLEKYGLWNDALASQWRAKTSFIVTESPYYQPYRPGGDIDTSQYDVFQTLSTNPCDPHSYLLVYKRKP
jgi:hypothetical protein